MQSIDELILQQRQLIIQMDQHYQKQVKTINERIAKQESLSKPTTITLNTAPVKKTRMGLGDQKMQKSAALFKPLPLLKK